MSLRLRRGAIDAAAPPVVPTYGPTIGVQVVKDGIGPRTVTAPGGAIPFATLGALTTAINNPANPPNSNFVATSTAYSVTGNPGCTWNAGKRPRIYFPGAPGTRTITSTGDNTCFSPPNPVSSEAEGYYEVHGGTFTGFGVSGSVASRAAFIRRGQCTIEDTIVTQSQKALGGGGRIDLDWQGHGTSGIPVTIRYNHFHHNWQGGLGDGGYGDPGATAHQQNYLFEWNEIDSNNQDLDTPGGDVAGCKFLYQVGTYRYNYVHDNLAWGLWWDTANRYTAGFTVPTAGAINIYDNVLENNSRPGIFFERSGYGHIHNNWCVGNGGGGTIGGQLQTSSNGWQMLVRNSRNCEVDHNDVDMLTGVSRTLALANQSDETSLDQNVHDNRIWLRNSSARVGGYDDNASETLWSTPTISWTNTLYMVQNTSDPYWQWGANETLVNWAAWQATGKDIAGTRTVI